MSHNCGIIKIDLDGNQVPEELKLLINDELEKNQAIVETIFPVIEERELQFIKKKARALRKKTIL